MAIKPLKASLVFAGLLGFTVAAFGAAVIVKTAPPAPQSVVVIGRAPSPRHIWIGGYWRWSGGRYVWVAGRWVVPPRAGAIWVPPMWNRSGGGFVFVAGRWR